MKSPSFQVRYAAVLTVLSILSLNAGDIRRGSRARKGLMSGPPGTSSMFSGGSQYAGLPGLTSNTGSQPQTPQVAIPQSQGSGPVAFYLQSQRYTTATALTPTVPGMYLVDVATEGGNNPGSWSLTYMTPSVAHFVAPASGTDATGLIGAERSTHYPVNWLIGGTNIASGNTAFNATSATNLAVTVTFSTISFNGPDISAYRAVHVKGSETGTGGTSRTFTFDAQPGVGRAMIVLIQGLATATGIPQYNVALPTIAGYGQQIPGQGPTSTIQLVPIQPFPPAQTLVVTCTATTLGGSTNVNGFVALFY